MVFRYFINGNWKVDFPGEMEFAGATWKYQRKVRNSEILSTDDPIDQDIIIEVLHNNLFFFLAI